MSSSLRERKPAAASPPKKKEEHEKSKEKRDEGPDLEPNIFVILGLIAVLGALATTFFYYKIDNRDHGAFSSWVNAKYPAIDRALNQPRAPSKPLFGASAQETTGADFKLTEEELKQFDGTDPDKPIYLGINGTIFDVSASPAFYGPGGHYHHFVGRDATRAWITECWDEPEQFTWRMDDVHVMFLPKWMDESLEDIAAGKDSEELDLAAMPREMLVNMAVKVREKFGSVTDKQKAKRRVEDKEEAEKKVQETLAHWVSFFAGNAKYKVAGTVIRDDKPVPPKPCAEAMKKRPIKGGKLEGVMGGAMGNLMGGGAAGAAKGGAAGGAGAGKAEMPAHIKEKIAKEKAGKEKEKAAPAPEEDDEDLVHDEL